MQVQSLSSIPGSTVPQVNADAGSNRGSQVAAGTSQVAAAVSVASDAVQATKHVADPSEVKQAVESLNKAVLSLNHSLQFSVDSDTKIDVVKVIDVNSKEVVRQIPSAEVISIAKAIDKLQGMLIKDKA
jgi:flagellar protein FlaG